MHQGAAENPVIVNVHFPVAVWLVPVIHVPVCEVTAHEPAPEMSAASRRILFVELLAIDATHDGALDPLEINT